MFGFLSPNTRDLWYRSLYARACQHLRHHHGPLALRFHSFESTLLFAVAADMDPAIRAAVPQRSCCQLRGISSPDRVPDKEVGQFCAALSMLLARIKLDDDVRDDGSLRARLGRRWLRKAFSAADRYFATLDPDFTARIDDFLDRHASLERDRGHVTLRAYTAPTADAFAYVFGLMAQLPQLRARQQLLSALGRHVGTAIIAFDCAVDWSADQRSGAFNPLRHDEDRSAARCLAQCAIRQAENICEADLGTDAVSARILRGVRERLALSDQSRQYCAAGSQAIDALLHPDGGQGHVYLYSACGTAVGALCCLMCCGAFCNSGNDKTVHVFHHRGCQ